MKIKDLIKFLQSVNKKYDPEAEVDLYLSPKGNDKIEPDTDQWDIKLDLDSLNIISSGQGDNETNFDLCINFHCKWNDKIEQKIFRDFYNNDS